MIAKFVIASLLAGTSAAGVGQDAARTADGSTNQWPTIHQCTLAPVNNFAINTKGTGAHSGRSSMAGEYLSRMDLQVTGTPGGSPTISAHAINTKGTGANSGRMSGARSPIAVACVTSQLTGDTAAQKASLASFNYMRAGAKSVGWSCSVSGSEEQPVFSVGLLVPTILGQAESPLGKAASWSWGVSNNRVSIVPRGAVQRGGWQYACPSDEPRKTNYDLVMMSKG